MMFDPFDPCYRKGPLAAAAKGWRVTPSADAKHRLPLRTFDTAEERADSPATPPRAASGGSIRRSPSHRYENR